LLFFANEFTAFACPLQFRANPPYEFAAAGSLSPTRKGFAMCARFIAVAAFAAACLCALPVGAEDDITQGTLIWRDDSCFFFVLKTPEGFGLYEFLGGPSPLVGNVFEGKLTGFGGRKLMNVTAGKPTMAYSETFTDSKKQMEKKIPRQCRKKKEFEALEVN
jgi:hypothetical protein